MEKLLIIVCSFSVVFTKSFKRTHCDITCEPNLQHTMCIFTEVNTNCEELIITPTDEIKDELLLWHNGVRSEFLQTVPKSVFPSGTNLRKMCWDRELAEMARRWASQCEPVGDRCRKLPRFEVGQNIGVQIGEELPPSSLQTFAEWAKPMDPEFSSSGNFGSSSRRKSMERFFQLISVDTYLIGCAEATYSRSGFKHRLLVCNYGPAAKSDMEQIYEAAVAIRKARIMEGRRMEAEERRRKQLAQRISFARSLQSTRKRKNGEAVDDGNRLTNSKAKSRFKNDGVSQQSQFDYRGVDQEGSGVSFFSEDGKNYCDINCNGGHHVMCLSDEDQPPTCDIVRRIDESILKGCVISKLNELRNLVAGGLPPLPSASDMRMLKWDEELAWLAGKWASQCSKVPDSCRDVERFQVNQLVMIGVSTEIQDESHCSVLMDAVSRLTSMLDDNVIQSYSVSSDDFLRYLTQAIWSKSSRVGCAEVLFHPEPISGMTALENVDHHPEQFSSLVCNFGEGGNQLNQKVFQPGAPCSHCPEETSCTDSQYPNLCIGDSPYTPRENLFGARGLEDDLGSGSGLMEKPFDYCEISCAGKQHVMCGPVEEPRSCNKIQVMDDSMLRKCVVSSLNELRNRVAEGNFSLPSAADMRMLIWDRELADLASRWAIQCPEGTDECRDVVRFPVNQIMMMHVSSETHDKSHCLEIMTAIANLLRTLNPNIVENYVVTDGDPLRYVTQSIWSKSSRVGCAEVLFYHGWGLGDYQMPDDFDDHTSQHSSLICNFGEGGNLLNQKVYQSGAPCSHCPDGTTCAGTRSPEYAPYPKLCVEENPS